MSVYMQLTREQRYQISALLKAGHNQTEIAHLIRVHKSTISRELHRIFDRADEAARKLGDAYVSTEHLLLALAEEKGTAARTILSAHGVSADDLRKALDKQTSEWGVLIENVEIKERSYK